LDERAVRGRIRDATRRNAAVRQQLDGLTGRFIYDPPLCQRDNGDSNDNDDNNSESSDANTSGNSTVRNKGADDNDPSDCDGDYEGVDVYDEMDDHPSALDSTEIASLLPRILQTDKINADATCKSVKHVSTASTTAALTAISTMIVDAAKRAASASDEEIILQSQGAQNQQQHPEHGFQHQLSASQAVTRNTLVTNVSTQLLSHEHQQTIITHLGVHSVVAGKVDVEVLPCLTPVSIAGTNIDQGRPWQFPEPLMSRPIAPDPVDQPPSVTRVIVNNTLIVRPTASEHRQIRVHKRKKVNSKQRGNGRGNDKKQRAPRSCVRCRKFGGQKGASCQGRLTNVWGQKGC
jgi:hypothetical protein